MYPTDGSQHTDGFWYESLGPIRFTIDEYTYQNLSYPNGYGSYNSDGTFTSWDDLVASGAIVMNGTVITDCGDSLAGDLVIPDSVTSIGAYAFYGCTGLTSIIFEGTPTTINSTAFGDTTNLTDIYVPWSEGGVTNAPWALLMPQSIIIMFLLRVE